MLTPIESWRKNGAILERNRAALPCWEADQYRLISLWEMLKPYAQPFAQADATLMTYALLADSLEQDRGGFAPIPDSAQRGLEKTLDEIEIVCREVGLRSAYEHIEALKRDRPWLAARVARVLNEIRQRMEDELKQTYFFYVPLSKVEFYDKPFFGDHVEMRFPQAVDDMREAATCFALGRWTSVAHHCMGVVQEGMLELGNHLGRPLDKYLADWNDMIREIETAITARRAQILGTSAKSKASAAAQKQWTQLEPVYSEILSDVRAMKNAWRNPGFHFRLPPFDEQKAKKVLERVREFMQNLADNI